MPDKIRFERLKRGVICLVMLLAVLSVPRAWSVVETYEFESEQQRELYLHLVETLRCPKCQNQNISDSNAPIAADMRKAVYRLIKAGKQEDEVIQYMVDRFGEFVVYKPKLDHKTWLLWFGPAVAAVIGLAVVILIARRNRAAVAEAVITEEEKKKLMQLLESEK